MHVYICICSVFIYIYIHIDYIGQIHSTACLRMCDHAVGNDSSPCSTAFASISGYGSQNMLPELQLKEGMVSHRRGRKFQNIEYLWFLDLES